MGNTPGYMKGTSSTMKKGSKKDVVKPASAISANKKTGKSRPYFNQYLMITNITIN